MVQTYSLPLSHGNTTIPHKRTLWRSATRLFLQDFCEAPFVASLKPDAGLRAFARTPEREHQLLSTIAARPDSMLTLAYTDQKTIVGQVTLAPADGFWDGLANTYEIAVEVSSAWRRSGIAQQLLGLVFEQDWLEDMIIIGMGLSLHWDMAGLELTGFAYRAMIERLFAHYSFAEYLTSEGNICMDPANIFLARLGGRVDTEHLSSFYDRLLQSDNLPGM